MNRILTYFKSLLETLLSWPYFWILFFPRRITQLISHFGTPFRPGFKPSLINILMWWPALIMKVIDLTGAGELLGLVGMVFKPNTRRLTDKEIREARKVLGNTMMYRFIRVDDKSLLAIILDRFTSSGGLGVTLFHTIKFSRTPNTEHNPREMAWLIHELVHVAQYERTGGSYIPEAILAINTTGYEYGGGKALHGKVFREFNREHQAEIIRDGYLRLLREENKKDKVPYLNDYKRMIQAAAKGEY